jgi:hypothetical protein
MYASISFQRVKSISASTFSDLESTPFFLRFESIENGEDGKHYSVGEICIHLENRSLADALVKAINGVFSTIPAVVSSPVTEKTDG